MSDRGFVLTLAGLAVGYFSLAAVLPPLDDEIYYWCWARELQPSYFDHPPMTAYLIRASTAAFGDTMFAIRLPACLTTLVVLAVIGHMTRPRELLPLVICTPLFTFGAVLITPDTPLLLFWAAYLLWLTRVQSRLSNGVSIPAWLWAVGGLALGCGLLGKYTAGMLVPAGFAAFVLSGRPWRTWLPGYVAHGVVAGVCVVPVLAFNIAHDFAPLRFQWSHVMDDEAGPGLETLGEFVGVQSLLFGTLPVLLFPWILRNWRSLAADPRLRACGCLFAVPFGYFLYKAARGPIEGNWALACYIGFWPVAAVWFEKAKRSAMWQAVTILSFAVPAGCVTVLATHLVVPFSLMPPEDDRIHRQAPRMEIARQVAARANADALPVYTPTYQWTALLRFYGADARQMDGVSRPSHFTQRPDRLQDVPRAYVLNEGLLPPDLTDGFGVPEVTACFPLYVREERCSGLLLMKYTRTDPGCRSEGLRAGAISSGWERVP